MGPDGDVYKVVLVLHLLAAIFGFGGLALNGFYGAMAARRRGSDGAAVGQVVDKGYKASEWPIYAVPILGIVLVLMSEDVFGFGQLWITLSFVLYIVIIGLLHAVQMPTVRRINALLGELAVASPSGDGAPPQVAELDKLGAKAGLVGGILNLLTVVVVIMMVFKPGFP